MKHHGVWKPVCLVVICLGSCFASSPAQEKANRVIPKQSADLRDGFPVAAQETKENVSLNFPDSPVWDILYYYQMLSHRPVYLSLDVQARLLKTQNKVNLVTPRSVSSSEACVLFRKALVDSCGVEVRDNGSGEILISEPPPATGKPVAAPLRPPD